MVCRTPAWKIPQQASVAGFNNQDICLMPAPQLTTVDQQIQATVDRAADFLFDRIGRALPSRPHVQMIDPLLVVRDSTGPAPR